MRSSYDWGNHFQPIEPSEDEVRVDELTRAVRSLQEQAGAIKRKKMFEEKIKALEDQAGILRAEIVALGEVPCA